MISDTVTNILRGSVCPLVLLYVIYVINFNNDHLLLNEQDSTTRNSFSWEYYGV